MAFSTERRDNKIYIIVAIFIIIVIILTIFLSTNQLNSAKIDDFALEEKWIEDISERNSGSGFMGLEKWASFTYKNNDVTYPAYVTVTTFKTLFVISEQELKNKMEDTIITSLDEGLTVEPETKISGERTLKNGHKTLYSIYNGTFFNNQEYEKIKVIGETWNCGSSITSIICIGYAQITDVAHNNSEKNLDYWKKILKDNQGTFGLDYSGIDGLLYNVKCH